MKAWQLLQGMEDQEIAELLVTPVKIRTLQTTGGRATQEKLPRKRVPRLIILD